MIVNNLGRTRKNIFVERLLHTLVIYFMCTFVGKCWWWCLVSNHVWFFGNPMDYSPPGSPVKGIAQAGILEWVAISFSRRSYQLRDQTVVSHIEGGFFTAEPPGKPLCWNIKWQIVYTLNFPLLARLQGKWMQSFILEVSVGDRYLFSSSRQKKNRA